MSFNAGDEFGAGNVTARSKGRNLLRFDAPAKQQISESRLERWLRHEPVPFIFGETPFQLLHLHGRSQSVLHACTLRRSRVPKQRRRTFVQLHESGKLAEKPFQSAAGICR